MIDAGLLFDSSIDALVLMVAHKMVDGGPGDPFYSTFQVDKIRKALLIRDPAAKSVRVERRALQVRAQQARKMKAKPCGKRSARHS